MRIMIDNVQDIRLIAGYLLGKLIKAILDSRLMGEIEIAKFHIMAALIRFV
jgi:hypothetical protein